MQLQHVAVGEAVLTANVLAVGRHRAAPHPAPARAAQFGAYAGASYLDNDRAADQAEFAAEAAAVYDAVEFIPAESSATFDTADSSYGFVIGYRLLEHLAIEGGYMDLGDVKYRDRSVGASAVGGIPESWQKNLDCSTSGIALSALGILPLSYRWEIYGRAGFLLSSNSLSLFLSGTRDDGTVSDKFRISKSGFDLLAGVGTSFSFYEIYSLRLE